MAKANNSLVNILEAIEKRANIYKTQIEELSNKTLDNLQKLFSKNINELTTDDLAEQPLTKLNRIIDAIELTPQDFARVDLSSEDGRNMLLECIKEYIKVNNDRIEHAQTSIEKCSLYADMLSSKKIDYAFTDLSDFNNFINTLGLSDEDKVYAQKDMATKNLNTVVLDPELTQNVTYMYSYVTGNPNIKKAILEYVKENDNVVTIDLLKTYCDDIAKTTGHSKELVQNVFVGMILSKEYNQYKKSPSKKDLQTIGRLISNFTYDEKQIVIAEANKVISKEAQPLKHTKINNYEDIVVTDALSKEEFDAKKDRKKVMLAHSLRGKVEDYYKNTDKTLEDRYKDVVTGLTTEYMNVENTEYQSRAR